MNYQIGKCTLTRSEVFMFNNISSLFIEGTVKTEMKTGKKTSHLEIRNQDEESYAIIQSTEYAECITNIQYIITNIMQGDVDDDATYFFITKEGLEFGVEPSQGIFKESWRFYVKVDKEDENKIMLDRKGATTLLGAFVHMYKETQNPQAVQQQAQPAQPTQQAQQG